MSFLDKAKAMISKDPKKVVDGVDKATDMIDDKTGGKYTEQLDKIDETVADKLAGDMDIEDAGDGAVDDVTDGTQPPA
jgi:hypothetical protein